MLNQNCVSINLRINESAALLGHLDKLRELEDKASQVKGGVAIISSLVIVSGLLGAGASKLLDFIFSKR